MNKTNENQHFKSFGALVTFGFFAVVGLISYSLWADDAAELKMQTMRRAESLAYQIIDVQIRSNTNGGGREPASESGVLNHLDAPSGEIGNDAWGHPFHFEVLKMEGHQARVLVWSSGANAIADSTEEVIKANRDRSQVVLSGDDIGVIVTTK